APGGPRQHPRPAHERRAEIVARRPSGDVEGSGRPAGRGPGGFRFEPRGRGAQRPAPPGSRGGDDMIGLLATYLRPYARTIVLILGLLLVGAIGNLYLPNLQGDIINNGVVKGDTDYILRVGGLMLLVTAVVGVTSIIAVYFSSRVAMGFGRDVRGAIFTKVQSFSQVEVNTFGPASLITRNTNDVQQVQQVIFVAMTIMVSAPILLVGGIFMAVRTDPTLSGLLLVILPIMALVI